MDSSKWIVTKKNVPIQSKRYKNFFNIASGGFGSVYKAEDTEKDNKEVAIKIIRKPFDQRQSEHQSKFLLKSMFRETRLLKHVNHHNVVKLLDIIIKGDESNHLEYVGFVFELFDYDLREIIDNDENYKILHDEINFQFIFSQLINGLGYLHKCKIIHCDLKPSNILIEGSTCSLKIIDFGLGRDEQNDNSPYLTTFYYAPPEILLDRRRYNTKVDIWSSGCILAEMILREILIDGSLDNQEMNHKVYIQFLKTLQLIGFPSEEYLSRLSEEIQNFIHSLKKQAIVTETYQPFKNYLREKIENKAVLGQKFKSLALDLILKMVCIDPEERISCADMITHDFFGIHKGSDDDDDDDDQKRNYSIFKMDNLSDISLSDLKDLIFNEVKDFKPRTNADEDEVISNGLTQIKKEDIFTPAYAKDDVESDYQMCSNLFLNKENKNLENENEEQKQKETLKEVHCKSEKKNSAESINSPISKKKRFE